MRCQRRATLCKLLSLIAVLAVECAGNVPAPAQTLIITNGSAWRWRPGTAEASTPVTAWRTNGFNDSAWAIGTTPFSYGTNSTGRDASEIATPAQRTT